MNAPPDRSIDESWLWSLNLSEVHYASKVETATSPGNRRILELRLDDARIQRAMCGVGAELRAAFGSPQSRPLMDHLTSLAAEREAGRARIDHLCARRAEHMKQRGAA